MSDGMRRSKYIRAGLLNGALSQGYGIHNPSIGSMLSLGIAKQVRKAGGNNVCSKAVQHSNNCVCRGPLPYCPCRTNKFRFYPQQK